MAKLKRIGVFFFAKLLTVMFGIFGLILGILYSFGGLIIDTVVSLGWVVTSETPGLSYGTVLAFGALIGMPAMAAGLGFVVGIIGAMLYNLVSKWFGGIESDFK
jgi:energy-converting hydrogenase Eha subunit A